MNELIFFSHLPLSSAPLSPPPTRDHLQDLLRKYSNTPTQALSPPDIFPFLSSEGHSISRTEIENYVCLAYVLLRAENPVPNFMEVPEFRHASPARKMMAVLLQASSWQLFFEPLTVPDLVLECLTPLGDAFAEKHLFWLLTCLQWVAWHYHEKGTLDEGQVSAYLQVLDGLVPISQQKIDEVIPVLREAITQYADAVQAAGKPFATVLAYPAALTPPQTLAGIPSLLEGKASASVAASSWHLHPDTCTLTTPTGCSVQLSLSQYKVMEMFITAPNRLFSADELLKISGYSDWEQFSANCLDSAKLTIEKQANIHVFIRHHLAEAGDFLGYEGWMTAQTNDHSYNKRFKKSQIICLLNQVNDGLSLKDLRHNYGVSVATYKRWKKKYAGDRVL